MFKLICWLMCAAGLLCCVASVEGQCPGGVCGYPPPAVYGAPMGFGGGFVEQPFFGGYPQQFGSFGYPQQFGVPSYYGGCTGASYAYGAYPQYGGYGGYSSSVYAPNINVGSYGYGGYAPVGYGTRGHTRYRW